MRCVAVLQKLYFWGIRFRSWLGGWGSSVCSCFTKALLSGDGVYFMTPRIRFWTIVGLDCPGGWGSEVCICFTKALLSGDSFSE